MTLLEKAKQIRRKTPRIHVNVEHIELALAWAREEITPKQFCHAMNIKMEGRYFFYIAQILKEAIITGYLKETTPHPHEENEL